MATKKKPVPLTPAEEEIAKAEVTAFYDGELDRHDEILAELERKMAAARAAREKTVTARTVWLDSGQITEDGAAPVGDPDDRNYQVFVTHVALAAGGRATRLAMSAMQAHGRGAADAADQHAAARAAFDRVEILKRWMLASGFPVQEF